MKKGLTISALVAFVFGISMISSACNLMAYPDDGTREIFTWKSDNEVVVANVPFKTFEGCDLQIWGGTFNAEVNEEEMNIAVGVAGWWGGAFVNDGAAGPTSDGARFYDMSKVAKITCDIKSSDAGKVWMSTSNHAAELPNQTDFQTTKEYATYTLEIKSGSVSSKDFGVFAIGGSNASGSTVCIKNIAFYDASGNEIVPTLAK